VHLCYWHPPRTSDGIGSATDSDPDQWPEVDTGVVRTAPTRRGPDRSLRVSSTVLTPGRVTARGPGLYSPQSI